jgi:Ran GTPase-activating protein (RanGAP) involved in mRNA processing and transport
MDFFEFLEKSCDILPKILLPDTIMTLMKVSSKFRNIIEKYHLPVSFIFNNLCVCAAHKNKSEQIVKYLKNNINKLNITNFILNNCSIKLIEELLQTNILQQYKNITKIELCDIELEKNIDTVYFGDCTVYKGNTRVSRNCKIDNTNIILKGLLQLVCPKLIELNLRRNRNKFGIIEIKNIFNILSDLRSLEILNLYSNNIDRGVEELSCSLLYLTNLKKLNLGMNNIRLEGIESITEVLPKLTQLNSLNLNGNNLAQYGSESLSKGLIYVTNLNKLNLGSNNIKSNGVKYITQILPKLNSLTNFNFSYNYLETEGFEILGKGLLHLTRLKKLDISGNIITLETVDSLIEILQKLTQLNNLNLSYNYLKSEGIKKLVKGISCLTKLNKLDIGSNYIKSEGFNYLVEVLKDSCTSLTDLNLSNNEIRQYKSLSELLNQCNKLQLKKLDISNNFIRIEGFDYLIEVLKESCTLLTELDMSNNQIGQYKSLPEVLNICNKLQLKKLKLGYNNFGLYSVNTTIELDINLSLQYLDIRGDDLNAFKSLSEIMQYYKSLSKIKISYYHLQQDEIDAFDKISSDFPHLTLIIK